MRTDRIAATNKGRVNFFGPIDSGGADSVDASTGWRETREVLNIVTPWKGAATISDLPFDALRIGFGLSK
jgi:hypothetical protein